MDPVPNNRGEGAEKEGEVPTSAPQMATSQQPSQQTSQQPSQQTSQQPSQQTSQQPSQEQLAAIAQQTQLELTRALLKQGMKDPQQQQLGEQYQLEMQRKRLARCLRCC